MSVLWFDGLLTQVRDAGVYFMPDADIEELLEAASVNRFPCLRVNLRGCSGRADLLLRIAGVLDLPPHVTRDWTGLSTALAALPGLGTRGLVLLLEASDELRAGATDDFKTAMETLQAASAQWAGRKLPLWSFIVLDEAQFDALEEPPQ